MSSELAPYNPANCSCCECSKGYLQFAYKGGSYVSEGYPAFDGSTQFFRTLVSRGYGEPFGDTGLDLLRNAIHCSLARAFGDTGGSPCTPATPASFTGSLLSQVWDSQEQPPIAPPYFEGTICGGDYAIFKSDEYLPAYHQAGDLAWPGEVPPGPRGAAWLLNPITAESRFREIRAYVESLPWPDPIFGYPAEGECSGYAAGPTGEGGISALYKAILIGYSQCDRMRYRRIFPKPRNGLGVRLEWKVWFAPDGESFPDPAVFELHSTQHYQWDHQLPPDVLAYDATDPTTWPRTPWYELPRHNGTYGRYYTMNADWKAVCGRTALPGVPGVATGAGVL